MTVHVGALLAVRVARIERRPDQRTVNAFTVPGHGLPSFFGAAIMQHDGCLSAVRTAHGTRSCHLGTAAPMSASITPPPTKPRPPATVLRAV